MTHPAGATPFTFGPVEIDRELPTLARMISLAFGGPLEGAKEWLSKHSPAELRALREAGTVRAMLRRIPMGLFVNDRPVAMLGIAGVAVAPEDRGRGYARRMMQELMREAWSEGWALSGLYASTVTLYRQVGYEQGGSRFMTTIPMALLSGFGRAGEVVAIDDAGMERVKACYARSTRRSNGGLDRSDYIWSRVRQNRDEIFQGFGLVGSDGALDAYVFLKQHRKPDTGRSDVCLSDAAFVDAAAGRRLLAFLGDFATMGDEVQIFGGAWHPLLMLLPQPRYTVKLKDYHMLRVVHLERAIAARGYLPGVDAELHLNVRDELLKENAGAWVVRVKDGVGHAQRGGRGSLTLDIRGLSAMFAGFLGGRQLPLVGLGEGDERSLATAESVFGGSSPWIIDMY
jgi:predicted acetyltransferase